MKSVKPQRLAESESLYPLGAFCCCFPDQCPTLITAQSGPALLVNALSTLDVRGTQKAWVWVLQGLSNFAMFLDNPAILWTYVFSAEITGELFFML